MIALVSVALAGGCDKLDQEEREAIATSLAAWVIPVRKGEGPDPKAVKKARSYDAKGQLCTPEATYNAAVLLTTGFDDKQTERAYELAKTAMEAHVPGAIELVPYAYDRFRVSRGLDQRFATMVGSENGRLCLFPIEDAAPDTERAAYKLPPLAERVSTFAASIGLSKDLRTVSELGAASAICHKVK